MKCSITETTEKRYTIGISRPDGSTLYHIREDLTALQAHRLRNQINAADRINPENWWIHVPYGSEAYANSDAEMQTIQAERYEGLGEGDELAGVC